MDRLCHLSRLTRHSRVVFKGPVHRTEKKDRNWTELDRKRPDQRSIYGLVFCSPVRGLSILKNVVKPNKTGLNQLGPVLSWECILDHVST